MGGYGMSAVEGKADLALTGANARFDPERT